jgi:hypothetical protein
MDVYYYDFGLLFFVSIMSYVLSEEWDITLGNNSFYESLERK